MPKKLVKKLRPPSKRNLDNEDNISQLKSPEKAEDEMAIDDETKPDTAEPKEPRQAVAEAPIRQRKLTRRERMAKERLIQAFDSHVQDQRNQIEAELTKLTRVYEQTARTWKTQLPARIRTMKVSEFMEKYSGNTSKAFHADNLEVTTALRTPAPRRSVRLSQKTEPRTTAAKGGPLSTPLVSKVPAPNVLATPSMSFIASKPIDENGALAAPKGSIWKQIANLSRLAMAEEIDNAEDQLSAEEQLRQVQALEAQLAKIKASIKV